MTGPTAEWSQIMISVKGRNEPVDPMPYARLKAPYTWPTIPTTNENGYNFDQPSSYLHPTPLRFLEALANSVVMGDKTPEVKNANEYQFIHQITLNL